MADMDLWFSGWADLGRVLVSGVVAFAALLTSIRLAGNRTLSNMNASDFVVTVAIGTTFATTMLSREVSIAEGIVGIATLIGIQYLTVWMSVKYPQVRQRAEGEPILLARDGRPLERALERARVSRDELEQALRQEGHGGLADIHAVFLEADGSFSVITRSARGDGRALS